MAVRQETLKTRRRFRDAACIGNPAIGEAEAFRLRAERGDQTLANAWGQKSRSA
jgi:hypothetical protein